MFTAEDISAGGILHGFEVPAAQHLRCSFSHPGAGPKPVGPVGPPGTRKLFSPLEPLIGIIWQAFITEVTRSDIGGGIDQTLNMTTGTEHKLDISPNNPGGLVADFPRA